MRYINYALFIIIFAIIDLQQFTIICIPIAPADTTIKVLIISLLCYSHIHHTLSLFFLFSMFVESLVQ